MVKVNLSGSFQRDYIEFHHQHPNLLQEVDKRIHWFRKNPDDARLRNHKLLKKMKGKFAFSITGDIRIVYEWIGKSTVRFLAIGGHKKVYTRKT
jgi:addiction module RelE/StbE family toxin